MSNPVNMSTFVPSTMHKPLAWLGKRKWVRFENKDGRWIIGTDKSIWKNLGPGDKRRYGDEVWDRVYGLLHTPYTNDKEELFTYAMSKALADGPKMFRPKLLQCKGFENTMVRIPFSQYAQPYETLLEFPDDYRKLKLQEGWTKCPKYVISWYDRDLKMIMVTCQFESADDRIISLLSYKPEHDTIETLLSDPMYFEADGTVAEEVEDFKIAQTFERIAVNLNLLIMYGDMKHITTPLNKAAWASYRELKKKYEKKRNKEGLMGLRDYGIGLIDEIKFDETELAQQIGFKVQLAPDVPGEPGEGTHASPKPHWRRGHWAQQPYGPMQTLRKPILRPPVFVVGRAYKGIEIDLSDTSVVITQKGDVYEPPAVFASCQPSHSYG